MRVSKLSNWIAIFIVTIALFVASSWYGAVLYVRHYPNIIEYKLPMVLRRPDGKLLTEASASSPTPFVMYALARRQPWNCWGSYTYFLSGEEATYSFPAVRSLGLSDRIHDVVVKNAMTIPPGLPVGPYAMKVTIFPTCDGVDVQPATIDLGVSVTVTN